MSNKLFQLPQPQPSNVPAQLATVDESRRADEFIAAVAEGTPTQGELLSERRGLLRDHSARTKTVRQAAGVRFVGSMLVGACTTLALGAGAGILLAGGVVLWQKVAG